MLMNRLIGREAEIRRLNSCLNEEKAQLVIVYGRRRVGKTFLINQFFSGRFDFKLTGVYEAGREAQLYNFTAELNRQTQENHRQPKHWAEAFGMLRDYLCSLPPEDKHIVFFDEMPWMDTARSGFLPAFEYFWNDFGCAMNNLVFIVCGSASSWMTQNFADNHGGLFNRQTCSLYLQPFTLSETEAYLRSRDIIWSRYDIAECYMILGGIPFYLSLLRQDLSLSENIDNLFFRKRAELWDEYDHLYRTLFRNSGQYIKVAETLSGKKGGMPRAELASRSGIPANGELTRILSDLEKSGFVRATAFFNRKKKEERYALSDYYSLFYFHFLKDARGRDEHFWTHTLENPSKRAWAGLTFEQLCMDHVSQIKRKLGISGVLSEESAWYVRGDAEKGLEGAQIDLLIDRRDRVINLCEIKYSLNEFVIDREYDQRLRQKMAVFAQATGTAKTLQLTMITTFGVRKNQYSNLVGSQVTLDDLFAGAGD